VCASGQPAGRASGRSCTRFARHSDRPQPGGPLRRVQLRNIPRIHLATHRLPAPQISRKYQSLLVFKPGRAAAVAATSTETRVASENKSERRGRQHRERAPVIQSLSRQTVTPATICQNNRFICLHSDSQPAGLPAGQLANPSLRTLNSAPIDLVNC